MTDFHRIHTALFDELARQGAMHVDIGRLTRAVVVSQFEIRLRCATRPPAMRPCYA